MSRFNSIWHWVLGVICLILSLVNKESSDAYFIVSMVLFCTSSIQSDIRDLYNKDDKE
jgi:hypothetical protein